MNSRQKKLAEERTIRKLYDRIPDIECKGLCWTTCGRVPLNETEARMTAKAGIPLPVLHPGDVTLEDPKTCPALTEEKRCAIYENRPGVCRAWGATDLMPCVYGCEPKMDRFEAMAVLGKIDGFVDPIKPEEARRRYAAYPELRRIMDTKRREGIEGDREVARLMHGPDVKLADDAQLGLTKSVYLDLSSLPT